MSRSHSRTSLTDTPAKKPEPDSGSGGNKVRTNIMVGVFLVLAACVAWRYWPESVPRESYQPEPPPPTEPGAKPVKPPTEPPPPPPDAPRTRPTITG